MESLDERLKYCRTHVTSVQPSPPKVIFKEVPWMATDEQLADVLYENVVTKVFDPGDKVCVDGELSDGIYIIVTGLLKLTYIPKQKTLDNLLEFGTLPVVDYITSMRFDEKLEDYIVSGNCIGELSTLTKRPYDCTIVADTPSQAYLLTHEVIQKAIEKNNDPVQGLEPRMWKSISIRLATTILMDTPAYQSSTQDKVRFQLERAFIPTLSNYKVFVVNDMMEDVVLIEGVVVDFNTRDCYTAPCYIPRTVQKMLLPKSSHTNFTTDIETKLLIIPARDVDEFDIMEREEEISEMVSTASAKCLQHLIQSRSSRQRRKKKRMTTFGFNHRRLKYGESRFSNSHSLNYSRSRLTNASSMGDNDETELQNISMSNSKSYLVNERDLGKTADQGRPYDRRSYARPYSDQRHSGGSKRSDGEQSQKRSEGSKGGDDKSRTGAVLKKSDDTQPENKNKPVDEQSTMDKDNKSADDGTDSTKKKVSLESRQQKTPPDQNVENNSNEKEGESEKNVASPQDDVTNKEPDSASEKPAIGRRASDDRRSSERKQSAWNAGYTEKGKQQDKTQENKKDKNDGNDGNDDKS